MADGQSRALTLPAGGSVVAIIPQSFEEAWRVAQVLSASGLTPTGIKSPEQCMVALMAGAEVGLSPFQSLQSFAVINGRPALWGDGMLAIALKNGVKVHETFEGAGDAMVAKCVVTRPDTKEATTRTFSVDDAKTAKLWTKDGPWKTYPTRMLQMRARSWALRDGCADLLRGIPMAEEAQDVEVIHVQALDVDQRPADELPAPQGAFMKGAPAKAAIDGAIAKMEAATTNEELAAVWREAQTLNVSQNRRFALAEKHALHEERLQRAAPERETAPCPFDEMKESGLECLQHETPEAKQESFEIWAGSLTDDKLGACTDEQRTELRTLYKSIKAEISG